MNSFKDWGIRVLQALHVAIKIVVAFGVMAMSSAGIIYFLVIVAKVANSPGTFHFWSAIAVITWLYLTGRFIVWLFLPYWINRKDSNG